MAHRTAIQSSEIEAIIAKIPDAPGDAWFNKDQVAEAVLFIAREFQPDRIILFGSRAYGTPTPESDADLLVVMKTSATTSEQALAIRRALFQGRALRFDIVVRTPHQIAVGLAEGDFFIEDMVTQGVTLYSRRILAETKGSRPDHDTYAASTEPTLKQATQDWMSKAEGDASSALHLLTFPDASMDNVCFFAQQCVEKYLKALLQQHRIRFPRTHDLVDLADRCASILPSLSAYRPEFNVLTRCAVDSRYPGLDISREEALSAIQIMTTVRSLVRAALGLDDDRQ